MKNLMTTIAFCALVVLAQAQAERCATMSHWNQKALTNPEVQNRMSQTEQMTQFWLENHPNDLKKNGHTKSAAQVTIPVVVHVLWNDPMENVSDAQIQSQIDVLNEDFRLLNADSLDPSHPFWVHTADTEIEFCLASVDPNGNPTNGITRTYTDVVEFDGNGDEKFTASGGRDNWDPTEYLNIWVCNLGASGGTLGYAAFPSDLATDPELDGVVIRYEAFGDIGTAGTGGFDANDLGRTATHEVGHWLNLRHIWGDDFCGDDFVDDTEVAEDANYGCPNFPHNANNQCGSGQDGEMYMNYMDYVDDYCMNMFTYEQALRMYAALNTDRSGLLTSMGCNNSSNLQESQNEFKFDVQPNPSNGLVTVSSSQNTSVTPVVYNLVGAEVKRLNTVSQFPFTLDLSDLPNGIYYLNCINSKASIAKRIIISN
jgi:hypothetical protein